MEKIAYVIAVVMFFSLSVYGQETTVVNKIRKNPADTSLTYNPVFSMLNADVQGNVSVEQSSDVKRAFDSYNASAAKSKNYGYKILVYSSNSKNARGASSSIASSLKSSYPQLNVYRSYQAPFFMVHVGDFRTKIDAMKILYELSPTHKQAKVVKSIIGWYAF